MCSESFDVSFQNVCSDAWKGNPFLLDCIDERASGGRAKYSTKEFHAVAGGVEDLSTRGVDFSRGFLAWICVGFGTAAPSDVTVGRDLDAGYISLVDLSFDGCLFDTGLVYGVGIVFRCDGL